MTTHNIPAVAAGLSVDPARWMEQFDELVGRIAGRFSRVEPRRRARAFVLGLLSGLRRKNCWTIAEQAGDATPDGMQHLLAAARWDADAVRDDVRAYVVEHLGSADAVLVVDETGDVKKGAASAGCIAVVPRMPAPVIGDAAPADLRGPRGDYAALS